MASQAFQKVMRKVGLPLSDDGYSGRAAMGRLPSGDLESSIRAILEAADYEVRQTINLNFTPEVQSNPHFCSLTP